MAVEDTKYIAGLDATKPTGSSPKSEGDDNLRLLKTVIQNSFPGFTGPVMVAATEAQGATANDFVVVSYAPAPANYFPYMTVAFLAAHANTGASTLRIGGLEARPFIYPDGSPLRANAVAAGSWVVVGFDGGNFRLIGGGNAQAIYDYIEQVQFESALPGMASQGGKFLSTDGTSALWKPALPVYGATPTANEGPVYRAGIGPMEWQGSGYAQVITKVSIGLGNVDNTSDAAKPISTATQSALNAKANLSGAAFSGGVQATVLTSQGAVNAGLGSAVLEADGNVFGSIWGGYLSNYLTSQLATKQAVGQYVRVAPGDPNQIYLFTSGTRVTIQVGAIGYGQIWTTNNFDPNTKKNVGNYVRDGSGSERITLTWTGSKVNVLVDGHYLGSITLAP
ncbi:hypothetical protein RA224_13025 [Achromobacter aegrifaciens]|uniref:hypothetical protein n=1 Tax=Achromobacter aegrifaciens TaxID=1287736 RepID=UPI0027BA155E|nr:hypothetical protein [Achromobacter aegrifaciens]WLW64308.1 hypothetical protein RA224_13025 [Achromobacter aegrifaciens]